MAKFFFTHVIKVYTKYSCNYNGVGMVGRKYKYSIAVVDPHLTKGDAGMGRGNHNSYVRVIPTTHIFITNTAPKGHVFKTVAVDLPYLKRMLKTGQPTIFCNNCPFSVSL